jgi:predicted DNA-binding transcriptional regulator YafY
MVVIKNQFFRQEIIDGLLGIAKLRLTKQELMNRINEKLEEKGINSISWRTLNNDLQYLREQGAEIHIPTQRDPHYYYLETFYTKGTQFDDEDIDVLHRGIQILKKIAVFRIARDIEEMLSKMKYLQYIKDKESKPFIAFEDHTAASGTEWLDELAEAIQLRMVLKVDYHSFFRSPELFLFHPYYLKEYRNRWFVLGRHRVRNEISTLALDRIHSMKPSPDDSYIENDLFNPDTYFQDMIGVTRHEGAAPEKICLIINKESARYVETKKIHHSQKLLKRYKNGSIEVELFVVINYELISTLLGFGAALKVLEPKRLVEKAKNELRSALENYSKDQFSRE